MEILKVPVKPAARQFDLDGVLVDVVKAAAEDLSRIAASQGKPHDIYNRAFFSTYEIIGEGYRRLGVTDYFTHLEANVLPYSKPYPGSVAILKILGKLYCGKINYVSARHHASPETTDYWFEQNYKKPLETGRIYLRDQDMVIRSFDFKALVRMLSGAELVYDDHGPTCVVLDKDRPGCACLIDHPWSRGLKYRHLRRIPGGGVYHWPFILAYEMMNFYRR